MQHRRSHACRHIVADLIPACLVTDHPKPATGDQVKTGHRVGSSIFQDRRRGCGKWGQPRGVVPALWSGPVEERGVEETRGRGLSTGRRFPQPFVACRRTQCRRVGGERGWTGALCSCPRHRQLRQAQLREELVEHEEIATSWAWQAVAKAGAEDAAALAALVSEGPLAAAPTLVHGETAVAVLTGGGQDTDGRRGLPRSVRTLAAGLAAEASATAGQERASALGAADLMRVRHRHAVVTDGVHGRPALPLPAGWPATGVACRPASGAGPRSGSVATRRRWRSCIR